MDAPAGVTQEEGHTRFLIRLPSAVLALFFLAIRIQPFLSLVDREVEFCVLLVWHFFMRKKIPVRVTTPRFELTSQRQKVSRLPIEPQGRPALYSLVVQDKRNHEISTIGSSQEMIAYRTYGPFNTTCHNHGLSDETKHSCDGHTSVIRRQ